MTGFHNVSFPLPLAFGASGGPSRRTEITQLANGAEQRNTPYSQSRRKYNAGAGVKTIDELHDLIKFFEARFGQLHSFRFRDPLDFKSCKPSKSITSTDQIIGTGDGERKNFQLIKSYHDEAGQYERRITKPISETANIAIDGSEITGSDVTINALTGEVIFNAAPPPQSVIMAGYEFDVPVRFDTDYLDLALEAFGAGQAINIPLIEVMDYA